MWGNWMKSAFITACFRKRRFKRFIAPAAPESVSASVAPTIITQPASQLVNSGNNVTLTVLAQGTLPLSYQWSFNGTNLLEATDAALSLTNVQISQSGNYVVQVSNSAGSIVSSNAVLTVNPTACVPVVPGLVSWWRGEGSASDELGANNGSVLGTVTYGPGKVGSAFEFDGVTSAIVASAAPNLSVQSLTIEASGFPH